MSGDDGKNEIQEIIDALPDSKPELLEGIRRLRAVDRYETADQILKVAIEAAPLPELRIERGRAQLGMGDYRSAVSTVEPLFSRDEPPARAFAVVAHAKAELGDLQEARQFLNQSERKGAAGRLVAEARSRIEEAEPPYAADDAEADDSERGAAPYEETTQLDSNWVKMVRATVGDSSPSVDDTEELVDPEPPTQELDGSMGESTEEYEPLDESPDTNPSRGGPQEEAAEPTVELDEGAAEEIVELDGPPADREDTISGSFWVAPTDPDLDEEDLFTHAPPGDDAGEEGSDTIDLQTDEFEQDAVGPSAWDAVYDTDGHSEFESRPVKIEPIDDRRASGGGDPNRGGGGHVPAGPGERTTDLDRDSFQQRVQRSSASDLSESALEEERIVDLKDPAEDDREAAPTSPEVPSAEPAAEEPDRGGWEPGDVLRPGPDPADSESEEAESPEPSPPDPPPQAAPTVGPPDSPEEIRVDGSGGSRLRRVAAIVVGICVGIGAAVLGIRYFVQQDASTLESALEKVAELESADTYEGWRSSVEVASETLGGNVPGDTRRFMHRIATPLLPTGPRKLRDKLQRHRVYAAAMTEFRFEHCGSRRAEKLAETIPESDHPRLQAAGVYRHLACGRPGRALESSKAAIDAHPDAASVVDARLAALLATRQIEPLTKLVESVSKSSESHATYREYLLARARAYSDRSEAESRLADLAERGGSNHLDARIARIEVMAGGGKLDAALEAAESLLDDMGEEASSYQRARLHRATGRLHARTGNSDAARKHFERATAALPERTDVYLPAIDFELEIESLTHAGRLLDSAEKKATETPALQVRRAAYRFETGQPKAALETLPSDGWTPASANLLRARIDLQRGHIESALKSLGKISAKHPLHRRARALEELVQLHGASPELEASFEQLEKLRSEQPDAPALTEISARAHLVASARLDTEDGKDQLDRALEEAELLTANDSYAGVGHLLACRIRLAQGALDAAREACKTARENTTDSIAAATASARVALAHGQPDEAKSHLNQLSETLRETWRSTAAQIRTSIAARKYGAAEQALADWKEDATATTHRLLAGRLAFARGNYEGAQDPLFEAKDAEGFPAVSAEAKVYLAHALTRAGEFDRAESMINEVTDLYRWKRLGWVIFGEIRRRQEAPWDALENLRIAQSIDDFPPVRPDRQAYLYTEMALTWRELKSWNHRNIPKLLDRAAEAGGADYPGYHFARGMYLAYRWRPEESEALEAMRRGLEAQPNRCDRVETLESLHDKFDVPSSRRSIPDAARKACPSGESGDSGG